MHTHAQTNTPTITNKHTNYVIKNGVFWDVLHGHCRENLKSYMTMSYLLGLWNLSIIRNFKYDKVKKFSNSECYTPLSEPLRFYICKAFER
jgi:hypothetical protein